MLGMVSQGAMLDGERSVSFTISKQQPLGWLE
jgi:hypothetical protein